jgi:hypothetical protein
MIKERILSAVALLLIFTLIFSMLQFAFTGNYFLFLTLILVSFGIILVSLVGVVLGLFIHGIWKLIMFVVTGKEDWL